MLKSKLIFMLLSLFFLSCSSSDSVKEKVPFEVLVSSFYSSITEKQEVIVRDQKSYIELMNKAYEYLDQKPNVPEVDFGKYIVIGVFMGAKPSGGHAITVKDVIRSSGNLTVYINEIYPGKNCGTTDAITYPFEIIKVSVNESSFKFKTKKITKDCE
ncbi:MAG: protease complex subunit PrcB family protein [Ignavibacteria bacterium]|nr:protease complex subunit PrcB family protein [Ignavibacteria bacterium]